MGSGKTTVGRELAALIGRPLIDNDDQIRAATGASVADISVTAGVAEMRRQLIAFAAKKPVKAKAQLPGESAGKIASPQAVVLPYKPASKRPAARTTLKVTRARHAIAAAR